MVPPPQRIELGGSDADSSSGDEVIGDDELEAALFASPLKAPPPQSSSDEVMGDDSVTTNLDPRFLFHTIIAVPDSSDDEPPTRRRRFDVDCI